MIQSQIQKGLRDSLQALSLLTLEDITFNVSQTYPDGISEARKAKLVQLDHYGAVCTRFDNKGKK